MFLESVVLSFVFAGMPEVQRLAQAPQQQPAASQPVRQAVTVQKVIINEQPVMQQQPVVRQQPVYQSAPSMGFQLYPAEQQLIDQTNAERARNGRSPLMMDPRLMESARRHCIWMVQRRSLQHGSGGRAENIAMGQRSAYQAVNSWMNSSGHRANILGGYSRIGVAGYTAPDGSVYWCQQFE